MSLSLNPTKKFAITALLVFVALGFSLNYFLKNITKNVLIEGKKNEATLHVRKHVNEYLTKDSFKKPNLVTEGQKFKDYVNILNYILDTKRVKIYNSDGIIIYSDVLSLVGKTFENNELKKALDGETIAHVHSADAPEHLTEAELGPEFIEAYIPIFFEDESSPSGIVEVYFDIGSTNSNILKIQKILWPSISVSFLFLFITLYWDFKNASNTVVEKNRALSEVSKTLKMAQEQDDAIMESMGEGLVVVNGNGQILLYNPKVEGITGYSSQDVLFRHYKNFIDLRDKDGNKLKEDYIKSALNQGLLIRKNYREEIFLKNKAGGFVPIAITIAPIFGREATIRGVVFTIHDARTEKELDKVKDEFVYIVAHELGNPIFAVDGYLSMAVGGSLGKVNSKIKSVLEEAKTINKQLSSLVSDLLEVIRSESGQLKFELEPVKIEEIIKEELKDLSLKAKGKNIKLVYEERNLPKVTANPQKLKEVITNLVDNAIKYSNEKTKVTISHEIAKDTVITNVIDNGIGMTKSEKEHLFEKFYRIRNEETKKITGTGLGLFIVKALIEKMNGDIWVESEKDKGSIFSFSLKIAKTQN